MVLSFNLHQYWQPLIKVLEMLKRIPEETRKKLKGKGFFPQDGYILQYLPVPPNCLSVPDVSDGVTVMSTVSQSLNLFSYLIIDPLIFMAV